MQDLPLRRINAERLAHRAFELRLDLTSTINRRPAVPALPCLHVGNNALAVGALVDTEASRGAETNRGAHCARLLSA